MTEQFTFSKEFTETNNQIRNEWEVGRKAARNVAKHLNKLVEIVHKEEPDWSINKIAQQIWVANEDLEGFSKRTIYNNLDEDHKTLLGKYEQNNVLEEKFAPLQTNVIEQSSSKRTLPTAYDIQEVETTNDESITTTTPKADKDVILEFPPIPGEEEPDEIYDKSFVDRLIKENAELVKQFSFDYDLEVKDQVLPLKITVYPQQKYGHVRIRKETTTKAK